MKTSLTVSARGPRSGAFVAALTVAATLALMVGAKTAKASDQQATEAQMSDELSYRAAQGNGILMRQYPSGAFASTRSHAHGDGSRSTLQQRDFQLEGR
jgi:hypothetical protein